MPFDGTPEVNTTIPQVVLDLVAAQQWLMEKGWCKGNMSHGDRRCIAGAVRQVVLGHADTIYYTYEGTRLNTAMSALLASINREKPTRYHRSIPGFNDAKTTTFVKVMDVFAWAIERELSAKTL